MAFNLRNRHFLTLLDFTPGEIRFLLDLAFSLKKAKYSGTEKPALTGKILR
jgi:ornithine carbamoyltransferase